MQIRWPMCAAVVAAVAAVGSGSALAETQGGPLPTVDSSVRRLGACAPDFVSARVASDVWLADVCGGLFRSSDAGKHWAAVAKSERPVSQLPAGRLAALMWLSEKNGLIVSGRGDVVRTTDGGRSWHRSRLPIQGPVLAGSRSGPQLWFCSAESQLARSDDAGATWKRLPPLPFDEGCGTVSFADRDHGFVAPSAGDRKSWGTLARGWDSAVPAKPDLWVTADGGRTWNKAGRPTGRYAYDTFASFMETPSIGWLFTAKGGKRSYVLVTGDGGQHWRESDYPSSVYPTLYFRRSTQWSSHFDVVDTQPTRTMFRGRTNWEPPTDALIEIPNRTFSPAEAATILDDQRALVVQQHLLRAFVGSHRTETFPLLSKGRAGPEQLLGVLNDWEQERWGWSKTRLYRSDDGGTTWYAVVDAPEAIARAAMAGHEQLLTRSVGGHIRRAKGDPLEWGPVDDPDEVMNWNLSTDPPGQHAKGLACLATANKAELTIRVVENGCFHGLDGRIRLGWEGDEGDLDADLTEFNGKRAKGAVRSADARAFANALIATTHKSDPNRCGSTTHRGVSLFWRCGDGTGDATHFDADECGDRNTATPESRVDLMLEQARAFVEKGAADAH